MADQEKDKQMQIDDMLDSLLANYSSAEPRPGLETRIMANLILANPRDAESREASRGWWGFKWLWAGAALAAVIVIGVLIGGKRHAAPPSRTVVQIAQPAAQQPQVQPKPPETAPEIARKQRQRRPHRAAMITAARNSGLKPEARPANFPTPFPLSEQERLMLAYLNNRPRQEVIAQMQRTDQKEAEEFWDDRNGFTGKNITR